MKRNVHNERSLATAIKDQGSSQEVPSWLVQSGKSTIERYNFGRSVISGWNLRPAASTLRGVCRLPNFTMLSRVYE